MIRSYAIAKHTNEEKTAIYEVDVASGAEEALGSDDEAPERVSVFADIVPTPAEQWSRPSRSLSFFPLHPP
jgi:hypothetical protein